MTPFTCILTVAAAVLSSASGTSLIRTAANVPLEVGSPLHLECGVQGPHRHCLWEAEDGRVLQVEDVHKGRHAGLRAPHNLTHNECGIVLEEAAAGDAGTWTCRVFLRGKTLSSARNVRKQTTACKAPFEPVGTGCFYFSYQLMMNWQGARSFCKSLSTHADLAKIDDCYLLELIWGHIITENGPACFWLGARDEHLDGVWRWMDGTSVPAGTPFWAPGEPNDGYHQEGCLLLQASTGYFGDHLCDHSNVFFICQDLSS